MGFKDFLNAINPIKLIGKGIDAVASIGKTIVSTPVMLAQTAVKGITEVASTLGNVAVQNVKNITGGAVSVVKEARGAVTDTVTQVRGAVSDTGKNLMLPLSIGAGVFAMMLFSQSQGRSR